MQEVSIKKIGILRGGNGEHYTSSLKKGGDIISYISKHLSGKYKTLDLLIDKEGTWHVNGLPIDNPGELLHKVDVVWNTSHSNLSQVLDIFHIPKVSSSPFASALETSKQMLKEHMQKLDVDMPRSLVIPFYQEDFDGLRERYAIKKAKEVHAKFGAPWIVKSFTPEASMAIHLAKTFDELVGAIEDGANHNKSILVEEFISGKVAALHSVPNFRNEDIYTFPFGNSFGNFTAEEKEKLYELVKKLHESMGFTHYLKSDFVINGRGKVYILGISTTPNLKDSSHFAEVCGLVGIKPHHVIDHILERVSVA